MVALDEASGTIARLESCPYSEVSSGYTFFREGDVLFAKITPCMENGKVAIAHGLIDDVGFGTTELHVIRPGPRVLAEWIYYLLRRPDIREDAAAHFTGAVGQQRVPDKWVNELPIPVPPLDEQRRIVGQIGAQLGAINAAAKDVEAQRFSLDAFRKAIVRETLSSHLQEYQRVDLSDLCSARAQYGLSLKSSSEGECPILKMFNVEPNAMNVTRLDRISGEAVSDDFVLQPGDILFNRTNSAELVGKTAVWDDDFKATFASYLIRLRVDHEMANPYYVAEYINSAFGRSFIESVMGRAIGQVNVSASSLMRMRIPVPPVAVQDAFIERIEALAAELNKIAEALRRRQTAVDAFRPALLRAAFSGNL
jgi:type I restriction enzyme S subunit